MVPVTDPKLAALLGHPPGTAFTETQVRVPTGISVGMVVPIPVPLVYGIWSRFAFAVAWSAELALVTI